MNYVVTDIAYKVIKEDEDGWVDVAIKATVENQSDDEDVTVELQGVDGEGFEVCSVFLDGHVPARKIQGYHYKRSNRKVAL